MLPLVWGQPLRGHAVCKGKNRRMCTELGDDPMAWSEHALLSPPEWFRDQLPVISHSVLGVQGIRELGDVAGGLVRKREANPLTNGKVILTFCFLVGILSAVLQRCRHHTELPGRGLSALPCGFGTSCEDRVCAGDTGREVDETVSERSEWFAAISGFADESWF